MHHKSSADLFSLLGIDSQPEDMFLLFSLGAEVYGTPLLGIRELTEPQLCQHVPNTVKHFNGVANIRGQLVGVFDLSARFQLLGKVEAKKRYLIYETADCILAAQVDEILKVVTIPSSAIDKNPPISLRIPLEFLIGIGKLQSELVTLIDLTRVLKAEEIVSLQESKFTA